MDRLTLPNPSPEDVSVVDVHHDPLAVQRVLVDGAIKASEDYHRVKTQYKHVATRIIRRNVPAFCDMVLGAGVGTESGA